MEVIAGEIIAERSDVIYTLFSKKLNRNYYDVMIVFRQNMREVQVYSYMVQYDYTGIRSFMNKQKASLIF